MFDVEVIRQDFPILSQQVNGKPLIYMDSGASSQKPLPVIEAMDECYRTYYANVHRGMHAAPTGLCHLRGNAPHPVKKPPGRPIDVPEAETGGRAPW